MKIFNLP